MKKLLFSILLAIGLAVPSFAQDCSVSVTNATSTGRYGGPSSRPTIGFDNRTQGCTKWVMTVASYGFSGVSVRLESAQTGASGTAGTWGAFAGTISSGSNPTTTTTQSITIATGFYPWVSVNIQTLTGSGTLQVLLYGWKESATGTINIGDVTLNTAGLAQETGGNLATAATNTTTLAGAVSSGRLQTNLIVGQVGIAGGSGVTGATTQRVTLATDVALPTGTNSIGQVTANAGTNLNTSALATETSLAKLTQTQASATSGQSGPLIQGAVTTNSPAYTTGQTSPISLDTSGSVRVNVVSGSTGNAAAGNTGSVVPSQADYRGINIGGTLRGQTGQNPSGTIYASDVAGVGTAGSPAGGVITVQGVSSATPILTTNAGTSTSQIGHLEANQSVNISQMNGATVTMGNGTSGAGVQRVTVASDSTGVLAVTNAGTFAVQVSNIPHVIVDSGGGGGIQYTEGDTDSTITGTALLFEGAANTLVAAPGTSADGLYVKVTNVTADSVDNAAFPYTSTEPPVGVGGIYLSSPADHTAGDKAALLTDIKGRLTVVVNNITSDTADNAPFTEAPVGVGGVYVAAPADHTDGDKATLLTDIKGRQIVVGAGTAGTAGGGVLTVQGVASMTPFLSTGTGTAGTAAAGVLTVQGIASMTPVQVSQATAANLNATVVGTGTFAAQAVPTAATSGGASALSYISVGSTEDKHVVKASAGQVYSITATNTAATVAYLKCENDTSGNTSPGSETPEFRQAIPGATTGAGFHDTFPVGWVFSTALTCWIVTGAADSDVEEVGANDVMIFYNFK